MVAASPRGDRHDLFVPDRPNLARRRRRPEHPAPRRPAPTPCTSCTSTTCTAVLNRSSHSASTCDGRRGGGRMLWGRRAAQDRDRRPARRPDRGGRKRDRARRGRPVRRIVVLHHLPRAAEVEFMNRIGFDAMTLGNHEFDLGPGPIADFIAKAEFPVLFGNVDAAADDRLGRLDRRSGDPRGRRRAHRPRRRPHPGHRRDLFARADRRDRRGERGPRRAGGCDAGGGRHPHHRSDPPGRGRRPRDGGFGRGSRRGRRRPFAHALLQLRRRRPYPYPVMVEGADGVAVPVVQAGSYSNTLDT